MIVDCHVHTTALSPGRGKMSDELLKRGSISFMRHRFGLKGSHEELEAGLEARLERDLTGAAELDAAVILAFDAVHRVDGTRDEANTHLFVSNDHVIELVARNPKMLFGASIHPYRKDAIEELERCAAAGAVLMKWLPITQSINPEHALCEKFYEALAHFKLPLLCHTGWEKTLPNIDRTVADPALLHNALKRGVTVIAAHCGTRSIPGESCFVSTFIRMARKHERFFGDTSALNLPTRSYAWPMLLDDDSVRPKLVHGSDWPIIPLPDPRRLSFADCREVMREPNWFARDILIKRKLGLADDYWRRAASVLRLPVSA